MSWVEIMKEWWASGQSLLQILRFIYGKNNNFHSWQSYGCQRENVLFTHAIFFSNIQEADMGNWDRKLKWTHVLLDLIRTNRQLQAWRRLLLSKANRTWLVVASPQKKQWLITKHLPSPPSSTKAKVIYWLSVCLQKWLGQFSKSCAFSTDLYDYQSWYKSEDTGDIIVRKWNHEFSASYVVYCTAF